MRPACSASAAVTPKETLPASAPGTGAMVIPDSATLMPSSFSNCRRPGSTPGAAPMRTFRNIAKVSRVMSSFGSTTRNQYMLWESATSSFVSLQSGSA